MFQRLLSIRFNPVQLTWVAALFFTTLGNVALWKMLWFSVEVNSLHSVLFFMSLPVFLFCFLNLLLTPVMILPYLRKPLLALLMVASASGSYFMHHSSVLIDRNMVQNVFETSQAELNAYLSAPLWLTLLLLGVLPAAAMVFLPTKKIGRPLDSVFWWLSHTVVTLTLFAAVTLVFYKDYTSLLRNNMQTKDQVLPFNVIRHTHGYLK